MYREFRVKGIKVTFKPTYFDNGNAPAIAMRPI